MKAYVCDKCGAVKLLEDGNPFHSKENGIYRVVSTDTERVELDLCEECFQELMGAVREMRGVNND